MALKDLSVIKRLFGASEDAGQLRELYREAMLMTLARATHSDAYTTHVEVETVQRIFQQYMEEEVSSADVRVAASSDLFESAPLEKWLGSVARRLDHEQCKTIVKALIEVIRVDGRVLSGEADFLNMVVGALQITPMDIVEICS